MTWLSYKICLSPYQIVDDDHCLSCNDRCLKEIDTKNLDNIITGNTQSDLAARILLFTKQSLTPCIVGNKFFACLMAEWPWRYLPNSSMEMRTDTLPLQCCCLALDLVGVVYTRLTTLFWSYAYGIEKHITNIERIVLLDNSVFEMAGFFMPCHRGPWFKS